MSDAEAKILFKEGINIGLVCGKLSNVIVVDIDSYKKESGITLESPVTVYTPRGGTHIYMKYQPLNNTANAEIATDIRGDGGFVVILTLKSTATCIAGKWSQPKRCWTICLSFQKKSWKRFSSWLRNNPTATHRSLMCSRL